MLSKWRAALQRHAEDRRQRAEERQRLEEDRRRQEDEQAWVAWRTIGFLTQHQQLPGRNGTQLAGFVRRNYQSVPRGTKSWVDFRSSVGLYDTFWPNPLTPPLGRWAVFTAHLWSSGTHSGEPVVWVDELLETYPASVEEGAQRHQKHLEREAPGASASSGPGEGATTGSGPTADSGQDNQSFQPDTGPEKDAEPEREPTDPLQWAFDQLELSVDASADEINAAYRKLAMMYHPDRNPGFSAEATERLKQINRAKDELLAWVRQNAQQT